MPCIPNNNSSSGSGGWNDGNSGNPDSGSPGGIGSSGGGSGGSGSGCTGELRPGLDNEDNLCMVCTECGDVFPWGTSGHLRSLMPCPKKPPVEVTVILTNGNTQDDSIIIDPSLDNTDVKCTLVKMMEVDSTQVNENGEIELNLFQRMLQQFEGQEQDNSPSIVFKYDPNMENPDGSHFGQTRSYDEGQTFEITFGPDLEDTPNITKMATIIHELVHALILRDLSSLQLSNPDYPLIIWQLDGIATISNLAESICEENNFNSEDFREHFAAIICKHLQLFAPNGQSNPQWMHELFNMDSFNIIPYSAQITNYLISSNIYENESDLWHERMEDRFGNNYISYISLFITMDALSNTNYFNNPFLPNFFTDFPFDSLTPMQNFQKSIEFIENGKFISINPPSDDLPAPANKECP